MESKHQDIENAVVNRLSKRPGQEPAQQCLKACCGVGVIEVIV